MAGGGQRQISPLCSPEHSFKQPSLPACLQADSLDVYQPQTLYWKATPVFTRAGGCDGIQQLTVRILSGFERTNLSQRARRLSGHA